MENEIYTANSIPVKIATSSPELQKAMMSAVEALNGDGWKRGQVILGDNSPGGGLREAIVDGIRVVFRYAAEQHAIIVVDVEPARIELPLAV